MQAMQFCVKKVPPSMVLQEDSEVSSLKKWSTAPHLIYNQLNMPSGMNEILPIISTVKIINSILVRVS
jgi:hypothetical protein